MVFFGIIFHTNVQANFKWASKVECSYVNGFSKKNLTKASWHQFWAFFHYDTVNFEAIKLVFERFEKRIESCRVQKLKKKRRTRFNASSELFSF